MESPVEGSTPAGGTGYCIALQPICDAQMGHVADELLYRADSAAHVARIDDNQTATARAYGIAVHEIGVAELVGSRKLFVNMPYEWLTRPQMFSQDSSQIVLEVLEDVAVTPDLIESLRVIRGMGYQVALDDFVLTPSNLPLLDVADIVKIDQPDKVDSQALHAFRSRGITMLAEKIETLADFQRLSRRGYALFQGYFFAKAKTLPATARERKSNYAAVAKLIALLVSDDAPLSELALFIQQDPELVFQILRYANSAYFARKQEIVGIENAILLLGRREILTIALSNLLVRNGPLSRLALGRALTRAYMCELLKDHPSESGAFVVGLLSSLDFLLGLPLDVVMSDLGASQDVTDAVLRHRHASGRVLKITMAFEDGDVCSLLDANLDRLNRVYLRAQSMTTRVLALVQGP